ncbi:MAG: ABC transporter ATP-binding protein [Verrucomicrobiota bacterium]|nr:ABC transporter ATP-binding protein [Limisphaera sp.]MDW8381185.1 ABC transporter ATP-binding protein [Verrucomicrobiota bacterium]
MDHTLLISKLTKVYPTPRGPLVVLEDFDLRVPEGQFVTLIGHSGCGKSTVLSIVAGLQEPTSGGVILGGREVTGPGPDRGVVFQAPCLLPWLSALENVRLGVDQVHRHLSRSERRSLAEHYLACVGLGDALDKMPSELSQGMRQRVSLARAFALQPKVLLLDEPFGMLDSVTRCELHDVLLDVWQQDRRTVIMVTHDVDEAIFLSDRVVMMTQGPKARVGGIVDVPMERPRNRAAVLQDPRYYELRQTLLEFLGSPGAESETEVASSTVEAVPG